MSDNDFPLVPPSEPTPQQIWTVMAVTSQRLGQLTDVVTELRTESRTRHELAVNLFEEQQAQLDSLKKTALDETQHEHVVRATARRAVYEDFLGHGLKSVVGWGAVIMAVALLTHFGIDAAGVAHATGH